MAFSDLTGVAAPPNVILLLADDLGFGELGFQGNHQIPTPHVDSIAHGGVRFTQAYVTAPNCSPSRAGLLTGQIPTRFGYEFNPIGARNEDPHIGLPPQTVTLSEWLHDRGYTTGLIGKWHLGGAADYHPMRHGFDEFFGFTHEGHYFLPPPWRGATTMLRRKTLPGGGQGRWGDGSLIFTTHMGYDEPDYDANNPILRGGQPVEEAAYLTDAFTRESVDFINRHADKPFFLLVAYNAVHSPLQGADAYIRQFSNIKDVHRRIFAAMLANLDDSVGAILAAVRGQHLEEDTLIIFMSDNGGPTRELTSSNRPLRGEKGQMYEGGIRVPMAMQWKGTLPAGSEFHDMVISVDLFATIAAQFKATVPTLDGVDLMPFMLGQKEGHPHESFFWRQGRKRALRVGEWKLLNMRGKKDAPLWELYHLVSDPSESTNLIDLEIDRARAMMDRWQTYQSEMMQPLF
ncbi:MAG: sulfatase-like hydrolase/transferase [Verrucomicrobiota bacterium]|nr:sulfatase-like hydrolase/transferase [Verrucomicrobiota bacterium]